MISIEAIQMLENIASDVKLVESTIFFYLNYTLGLILLLGFINVINKLTNNILFIFANLCELKKKKIQNYFIFSEK